MPIPHLRYDSQFFIMEHYYCCFLIMIVSIYSLLAYLYAISDFLTGSSNGFGQENRPTGRRRWMLFRVIDCSCKEITNESRVRATAGIVCLGKRPFLVIDCVGFFKIESRIFQLDEF